MSSLYDNTESIPGVGTGILIPCLANRFMIKFSDDWEDYKTLTNQVLKIEKFEMITPNKSFKISKSYCNIIIEPDMCGGALNDIINLSQLNKFNATIEILDGTDNIMQSYKLVDCNLVRLTNLGLSYSDDTRITNIRTSTFDMKWKWVQKLSNALSEIINNTKIIHEPPTSKTMLLNFCVEYSNVEITTYN